MSKRDEAEERMEEAWHILHKLTKDCGSDEDLATNKVLALITVGCVAVGVKIGIDELLPRLDEIRRKVPPIIEDYRNKIVEMKEKESDL